MSVDTEIKIAKQLVKAALDSGYLVSVWEGEDYAIVHSDNLQDIMNALGSTDEDVLMFSRNDKTKVGWVLLVWGNDEDVISDSSVDPETERLCDVAWEK